MTLIGNEISSEESHTTTRGGRVWGNRGLQSDRNRKNKRGAGSQNTGAERLYDLKRRIYKRQEISYKKENQAILSKREE